MRTLLGALVAVVLGLGCDSAGAGSAACDATRVLPHYDSAEFTPRWNLPADADIHRIRPFRLTDQDGAPFTERDLDGKITVVDFFFTSCGTVCPRMTDSMYALHRAFRDHDDVRFVSHSVTPDTDTVEVLRVYAMTHKADTRRWKFLTGDRNEIYDLGRKSYFVDEDLGVGKGTEAFLHTENFVLLDGRRRLRGIYNSLDPNSMDALALDIKVLQRTEPRP